MVISIELLYSTLCISSLILIVLQIISIKKKNIIQLSISKLIEHNSKYLEDTQNLIKETSNHIDSNFNDLSNNLNNSVDRVTNDIEKISSKSENQFSQIILKQDLIAKNIKDCFTDISHRVTKSEKNLEEQLLNLIEIDKSYYNDIDTKLSLSINNQDSISLLVNKLDEKLTSLKFEFEKLAFTNNQSNIALTEQVSSQIQSLRIDNLVTISNELAKQKNLSIETNDFIKQLGDCKVTQIQDKHSGQVTKIHYEKGSKRSSETLSGTKLKYRMTYDVNGKPEKGLEYDEKGNLIFEYFYNSVGEINKRTEITYDESGKKTKKLETVY